MQTFSANKGIVYWLRWLDGLPSAILAGMLALFPLHFMLYGFFVNVIGGYSEAPERILSPLASAIGFIYAGSRMFPEFKIHTTAVFS